MTRKSNIAFAVAFVVAFPIAFIFTRYMEATLHFDSIGVWYTLYVSTIIAAVAAAVCALLVSVLRWRRRRNSGASR